MCQPGLGNAIKECHCQDLGRTKRIFSAKNGFKPGFQATEYLADSMEIVVYFSYTKDQVRTKINLPSLLSGSYEWDKNWSEYDIV